MSLDRDLVGDNSPGFPAPTIPTINCRQDIAESASATVVSTAHPHPEMSGVASTEMQPLMSRPIINSRGFVDGVDEHGRAVQFLPYSPQECGSFSKPVVEEETIYAKNHRGETVKVMRITMFCPAASLSKQFYFEKWKSTSDSQAFLCLLGNVHFNTELALMQRLQSYHIMGTALRQVGSRSLFYFSGQTLDNTLILMEIIIDHAADNAGLVRYKVCDEGRDRDVIFESFICELLSREHPQLHVLAQEYAERLANPSDGSR